MFRLFNFNLEHFVIVRINIFIFHYTELYDSGDLHSLDLVAIIAGEIFFTN